MFSIASTKGCMTSTTKVQCYFDNPILHRVHVVAMFRQNVFVFSQEASTVRLMEQKFDFLALLN